jgi:hypothetical protein
MIKKPKSKMTPKQVMDVDKKADKMLENMLTKKGSRLRGMKKDKDSCMGKKYK